MAGSRCPELLSDAALAAAFLQRLGFDAKKAAQLATSRPLSPVTGYSKELLCELIRRHLHRVPFENLDQHTLPGLNGLSDVPPVPAEERKQRLREVRRNVERLAFGSCGGFCFDLSTSVAWLLRQLGASVRLAMAWVNRGAAGYSEIPTHVVVLVDRQGEETLLVDVGFGESPRTAVGTKGSEASDVLACYKVEPAGETDPAGSAVLRRLRGAASVRVDLRDGDAAQPPADAEAAWESVYAFRPEDDLAYDAGELQRGLDEALAPGATVFSKGRLLVLCRPKGHVMLSERRKKCVEDGKVTEEVPVESEEAWKNFAGEILGLPLLSPAAEEPVSSRPSVSSQPTFGRQSSGPTSGRLSSLNSFTASTSEQIVKAGQSQMEASSKASNLGQVDAKSLAVGGAGAGGGLGLNKPGFGPKVTHFSGGSGRKQAINISQDVPNSWAQVLDDTDPVAWVLCTYSEDGKTLELSGKGEGGLKSFKEQLGNTLAWGGFRCYGVDKRGGVECKRPKLVFVQYKPESASAIKKAKQGAHKGDVKDVLSGAHLDVIVESQDDLDQEALILKLQAAAGAHKPNGYMFDDGCFMEADFYGLGIGKECKGETARSGPPAWS